MTLFAHFFRKVHVTTTVHTIEGHYSLLDVHEDIQMSKFVNENRKVLNIDEFENGKAFFEFTRSQEDVFNDTEVVVYNKVRFFTVCCGFLSASDHSFR